MSVSVLYQRSCVFKPSVSRMMTCWYLMSGSMAGTVNGPPPTSDIQPTCKPMAWLVLPAGVMLSTKVFMLSHSKVSPFTAFGQELYCSAGYSDDHRGVTGSGVSALASKL